MRIYKYAVCTNKIILNSYAHIIDINKEQWSARELTGKYIYNCQLSTILN